MNKINLHVTIPLDSYIYIYIYSVFICCFFIQVCIGSLNKINTICVVGLSVYMLDKPYTQDRIHENDDTTLLFSCNGKYQIGQTLIVFSLLFSITFYYVTVITNFTYQLNNADTQFNKKTTKIMQTQNNKQHVTTQIWNHF